MHGGVRMTAKWRDPRWRLALLGGAVVVLVGRLGCGYDPQFKSGVTRCAGPSFAKRCPDGFVCDETTGFCVTRSEVGGGSGGGGGMTPGAGGGSGVGGPIGGGGGAIVGGTGGGTRAGTGGTTGGGTGGTTAGGTGGHAGTGGTVVVGTGGMTGTGGTTGIGGAGGKLATGTIKTYPVTANGHPLSIITGPDMNLWFVEPGVAKFGRITPAGMLTEFNTPTAASGPYDIVSQGGFLWFVETNLSKIAKADTSGTVLVEYPIPVGASPGPYTMAVGPDGNIWWADTGDDRIGRMIPGTGATMTWQATAGSEPTDITTGLDGNLWFTEFNGNRISQITPTGAITRFALPTASAYPIAITAESTTTLLFVEIMKIGRITISGATSATITAEYPESLVANSLGGQIVVLSDGNAWFTNGGDSIIRMTPAGTMNRYVVTGTSPAAVGLTAGPDGNLWFTDRSLNTVGRIAP